jgi:hypothetical protein
MLSSRIALGVLLAGVAQTRAPSDSDRQWYFLPHAYYIGGLSWAAVMTIFAASRHIGGAIMQIWQIDVGVAIALLFNFAVFSFIPMNQEDLIQVPLNFNGTQYYISLQDWSKVAPLILLFTLVMFVSPMDTNVKKFAVSTNLYFSTFPSSLWPGITALLTDGHLILPSADGGEPDEPRLPHDPQRPRQRLLWH